MLLCSKCLFGFKCKYDGGDNENRRLLALMREETLIHFCPEQLGGLSTPRKPAEVRGGTGEDVLDGKARVVNCEGKDVTAKFKKGANQALKMAELYRDLYNLTNVILKARSPSCGFGRIHDGTFTGSLVEGNGVTAALLDRRGFEVKTEEDL